MSFITVGEHYATLWQAVLTSIACVTSQSDQLTAQARALGLVAPDTLIDSTRYLKETRQAFFNSIVRAAETRFGTSFEPIMIDQARYASLFLGDRWEEFNPEQFDAVGLCRMLEEDYSANGEAQALAQVAQAIITEFRIHGGDKITFKRGSLVINLGVFIDSIDKKYSSTNRLSIHSRDRVRKAFAALVKFATWADDINTVNGLLAAPDFYDWNRNIQSRAKHVLGGIVLTEYTTRFEFTFSSALSASLQEFLGTYGNLKHEEVA